MNRLQQATVICLGLSVHIMWAQSTWPNYPNNTSISVSSAGDVGIGTTTPGAILETFATNGPVFRRDIGTGTLSSPQGALQVGVTDTSSANVNIGPSLLYFSDNASGTKSFLGRVSAVWRNPAAGSEAGDLTFSVRANSADSAALTEAMRITASGNVGIGTTNPLYLLTLRGQWATLVWQDPLGSPAAGGLWRAGTAGPANAWGLQTNTASAGDFSSALQPITVLGNGNVGIGTTSPQQLLDVAGTMAAREIIVSQTGADYVFDPGYRLAPLTEVANYINEHRHLPDIPSASDMQQKGASVGEMQAKLLAKIEELTLHMIQAEERSNRLEQQNRDLQERINGLESKNGQGAGN